MDAHLVKGMDQGDRELWVTDLAKVAYVRGPNHTRKIQFNKLPVHRERRMERGREGGQSLHFPEKTPVSSESFTKIRENKKEESSEFLSLERLQIKERGGKKGGVKRKQGDECYPSLCYRVYFSLLCQLLIPPMWQTGQYQVEHEQKSGVFIIFFKKAGFTLSALIVNPHLPNVSEIFTVKLGSLCLEVAFHFPDLREMLIKVGK